MTRKERQYQAREDLKSLDVIKTELTYLRDEVLPERDGRIKILETDLRTEKRKIVDLEQNVATLTKENSTLKATVGNLEQNVATLTKENSTLKTTVGNLEQNIAKLERSNAADKDSILVGQLVYTWIHEFARQKGEEHIWDVQSLRGITGSGRVEDAQLDGEAAERILGRGHTVQDLTAWFGEVTAHFRGGAHSIIDVRTGRPVTPEGMESILKAEGMFRDNTRPIILRVLDDVKQWRQGQSLLTKKAGF